MKSQHCNGCNRYYNGIEQRDYERFYLIIQEKLKIEVPNHFNIARSEDFLFSTTIFRSNSEVKMSLPVLQLNTESRDSRNERQLWQYKTGQYSYLPVYINKTWRRLEPLVDMQRYIVYFWLYCSQEWNFKLTEMGFVWFEYNSFRCFGD